MTTRTSASLLEHFERGLSSPICLTWELTYACNLACVHCLSSSGRRDPHELRTNDWKRFLDDLAEMQVFYVNIGGGEPTIRSDFWDLISYAVGRGVGVKFSTNGSRIDQQRANQLALMDYVDVQVSLDGATAEVNDRVRGVGSFQTAVTALERLAEANFVDPKISVVVTKQNVHQLDDFASLAELFGGTLRLTRLRPSGRGVDVWDELRLEAGQQQDLYEWLVERGEKVLTGDSFFHLSPLGGGLEGLNMCGAGRVVCLVDPVGDVYSCPFAIHEEFRAGNILEDGGFAKVWQTSAKFQEHRNPSLGSQCQSCSAKDSCRGGCMAAKFFTGLSLSDPDPECVFGHGEQLLSERSSEVPRPSPDHSIPRSNKNLLPVIQVESRPCEESPIARWAVTS